MAAIVKQVSKRYCGSGCPTWLWEMDGILGRQQVYSVLTWSERGCTTFVRYIKNLYSQ